MDRRKQRFKKRTAVTKEQALNFLCANEAAEQNREAHQCGKRNSNGITQPSGAATPRNSDAHKRIAVPRLSAFFGSTPDQDPKAAKYAVLIPGPGMFVNVRNAPRVVIPPTSETPLFRRVSPCVRSFSESRVCTRFHA